MSVAIISLLIIILCIYLLAIITEGFFVESLEVIAKKWQLPANVAGASLMAMGSSMPELCIALIALVQGGGEHSDIGIGNIVGSAIFNILVITGVSALVRPAKVTWQVIGRDIFIYVLTIGLLLYSFSDGQITLIESLLFLGLYAIYLLILFQWNKMLPELSQNDRFDDADEPEHDAEPTTGLAHISVFLSRIIGFLTGNPRLNYIRTFIVSIIFIALISWYLVEYAIIFAQSLGIAPVIVALTIVAGGSSVPDLLASVLESRRGRGEMAVANAVGSNIFDIAIGLGFPWLLVLLFQSNTIVVGTGDLLSSTFLLLATVLVLLVFLSTGWLLSRIEGAILLILYVVYVVWIWSGGNL